MIKLYKDEKKNSKMKEIIADLRKKNRGHFPSNTIYLMKKLIGLCPNIILIQGKWQRKLPGF